MLQIILNYVGIAVFASSGAIVGVRKGFDLFGIAALGRPHPRAAARLWIAATAECALMELEAGRRDQAARSALNDLVG